MSASEIKMIYNSTLMTIKVELVRNQCMVSEAPPTDLIARARTKMESVLGKGDISQYHVFENRLKRVWTAFRNATDIPDNFKLSMTLANGVVELSGIKVEKSNKDKTLINVSISATPSVVGTWKYDWFKALLIKRTRDLGINEHLNNAQIYSAFARAVTGERVEDFGIGNTSIAEGPGDKPFSVVASKQRREICVVIRRAKELLSKPVRDSLLQLVNQAVTKMSEGSTKYVVQKKDFIAALQTVMEGPEILGEDLPVILLAAHAPGEMIATVQPPGANIPSVGPIYFKVSDDKMEAAIAGFDQSYYKKANLDISVAWVEGELKRCSIKSTIDEEVRKKLSDMIIATENLNGLVVCFGVPAAGGREPFIFHSYKDVATRLELDHEDDHMNMRDLQQRTIVREGQLVAELRFKSPAENGINLYGDSFEPTENDELIIHVGEGIQQKGRRFYATCDGVPVIENETISLAKSMIFSGDVNLRSGNVRFDGPVEIKGAIDNGAVVETTGDLIVHGTIRGAHVKAGGNIFVYAGIVTGNLGSVYAGGDIKAEFAENSNLTCRGSLIIGKALLNSRVVSNGGIEIRAKDGVLAGGKIICRQSIKTGNLGFKRGAKTDLLVGIDWRIARRIEIRRERLERLEKATVDYRLNLRELVQKSKNQLTAKHKIMKEDLQKKLVKSKAIIERVQKFLKDATAQVTYNQEAKILVVDQLSSNIKIQLCGQTIAVPHDVANVAIVPKRRRGSHIVPLEEVEKEERDSGLNEAS